MYLLYLLVALGGAGVIALLLLSQGFGKRRSVFAAILVFVASVPMVFFHNVYVILACSAAAVIAFFILEKRFR